MKHIQKFNESIEKAGNNNTIIDIDYIENCFVEFKDAGTLKLKFNYYRENSDRCSIEISTRLKPTGKRKVLNDVYRLTENKLKIVDEISYSFEKVKIKYPYMQYQIDDEYKNTIKIEFALDTCGAVIRNPGQWVSI